MTDLEKAYFVGYRDGYKHAKTEMQHETDELIDRVNKATAEINAEGPCGPSSRGCARTTAMSRPSATLRHG